jgi:uncharacterized protein
MTASPTLRITVEERSGSMAATFEVYKDGKGEYRWRLRTGNGQVIATGGEGYSSKANALGGVKAVQRDAPVAQVVDADD